MMLAPGVHRQLLATRSLGVQVCAATLIALLVYLLHAWFHDDAASALGLSTRAIDTLGTLGLLAFFVLLQRNISTLCFRDSYFGMRQMVEDARPRCPSNHACERLILPELREIPPFHRVLVDQLHNVTEQTEKATVDITARLHTIDGVVTELRHYIASATTESTDHAAQLGSLGERYQRMAQREKEALERIGASSEKLATMFVDALLSVQFQDITRQQIEQVIAGMAHIDTHTQSVADIIENEQHNRLTRDDIPPLKDKFGVLYSSYVMAHQREIHDRALGRQRTAASGQPEHAAAHSNKVELF